MQYKFVIPGTLPNLNDYLKAERVAISTKNGKFNTKGNLLKHQYQDYIIKYIRKDLRGVKISNPIILHYHFFEPNKKRDLDNIASFVMKVTQDSLVLSKTISNDGWDNVHGFDCSFSVDKQNPRIEVEIEEIRKE